ncbi:single-stranded DNA-binding protein [Metamycoplasma sualvi]|uniref:single-stranded DNA-binding protein n=1 Tax=Metamycoplasma sualvi TaxID=2125 RepID=UPI003872FB1C
MNLNKVILIGRLSQDIVMQESKSNINYVRTNLAITRDNQGRNSEEITDFIPVVAFGNNATYMSRFFGKGDLVNIVGTIQSSQYTTKSGDIVSSLSIVVEQIKSLEPRSITQARNSRKNSTIAHTGNESSINNLNQPTFYEEDQKNELTEDDNNPWELDF